jgi:hypothetical protein
MITFLFSAADKVATPEDMIIMESLHKMQGRSFFQDEL